MGDFPTIEVPFLSGGIVIAIIALTHVVIAHFGVGVGFLLHALERRNPDPAALGAHERAIRILIHVLVYGNFVVGALSGVGIWFAISIFSPEATRHLISKFVWLWATEWVFFALEIAVAYIYYYRRDGLSHAGRTFLTGLYAAVAWLSLLVITGILSYMLTSVESPDVFACFFNPSMLPSVVLRTGSAICLAALGAIFLFSLPGSFPKDEERQEILSQMDRFLLVIFVMLPAGLWFRQSLPSTVSRLAEGHAMVMTLIFWIGAGASTILGLYAAWAWINRSRKVTLELATLLLGMGIVTTVSFEFVREGLRKPFVIQGQLYSNGLEKKDFARAEEHVKHESVLTFSPFAIPRGASLSGASATQRGEWIFHQQCLPCHTHLGFNAIEPLIDSWTLTDLRYNVPNVHRLKPFMPRFIGTSQDIDDLARYLLTLNPAQGEKP